MGRKGGRVFRNMYKDTWTKPLGVEIRVGRWGWLGWGVLGEWRQLYLNNTKKLKTNKQKKQREKRITFPSCFFPDSTWRRRDCCLCPQGFPLTVCVPGQGLTQPGARAPISLSFLLSQAFLYYVDNFCLLFLFIKHLFYIETHLWFVNFCTVLG